MHPVNAIVKAIGRTLKGVLARSGYQLSRALPEDMQTDHVATLRRVQPYTMTTPERILSCIGASDSPAAASDRSHRPGGGQALISRGETR
jgi:hypothetical protein